jgi:opacity protein-like surface antigen
MKRNGMIFLVMFIMASATFAQGNTSLAITTGYTMSAFKDQEDAAGTLPIGLQLGYLASPNVQIGLEVSNALAGFTWQLKDEGINIESTFNQTIIDVYGKLFLGSSNVKPYIKGGVGYFLGDNETKVEILGQKATEKVKMDPNIGFTVGGGVTLTKKLFLEFNYNIVSRKAADSASLGDELVGASNEKVGMNTWSVLVGYTFKL